MTRGFSPWQYDGKNINSCRKRIFRCSVLSFRPFFSRHFNFFLGPWIPPCILNAFSFYSCPFVPQLQLFLCNILVKRPYLPCPLFFQLLLSSPFDSPFVCLWFLFLLPWFLFTPLRMSYPVWPCREPFKSNEQEWKIVYYRNNTRVTRRCHDWISCTRTNSL